MYSFCDFCGKKFKGTTIFKCGYKSEHYTPQLIRINLCQECIDKEGSNVVVRGKKLNE